MPHFNISERIMGFNFNLDRNRGAIPQEGETLFGRKTLWSRSWEIIERSLYVEDKAIGLKNLGESRNESVFAAGGFVRIGLVSVFLPFRSLLF